MSSLPPSGWLPPAGWYPDPEGTGNRYWDGRAWAPAMPPAPTKAATSSKGRVVFVIALALGLGGCFALMSVTGGKHSSSSGEYVPPSGVSSTDAAFLKAVHGHGLSDDQGDQHMITVAHAVCLQLSLGQSVEGLSEHWGLTNERLSTESARFYVRTAAAAYCPEEL